MLKIKVLNNISPDQLPKYSTSGSAGVDIQSNESGTILPNEVKLIKTGLTVEIPEGYEVQIRPRSGLALKHGVTILNSPGTIDSDYRGEIGIIMINHSKEIFYYKKGDRIAQMVVSKYEKVDFELVETLTDTARSSGGFGSTNK